MIMLFLLGMVMVYVLSIVMVILIVIVMADVFMKVIVIIMTQYANKQQPQSNEMQNPHY